MAVARLCKGAAPLLVDHFSSARSAKRRQFDALQRLLLRCAFAQSVARKLYAAGPPLVSH